jgi:small conductance mechanosensitive channel
VESTASVDWVRILTVAGLGVIAWFGVGVLLHAVRRALMARCEDPEDDKRVDTVVRVTKYIAGVTLAAVVLMLVLSNFGISIAPLLGAAGIAGVAAGLAAQGIARDIIRGLSLLIDNQIRVGDTVEIAGKAGVVEAVTIRTVTLRDYEGAVHFVPMGEVHVVTNRSHGHSYALLDVGIGCDADVDDAMRQIRDVAENMRAEAAWARLMLEPVDVAGVERWQDASVVIRARIKVPPGRAPDVRREMLRRLKNCFDREGIQVPYPQVTLVRAARAGSRPARRRRERDELADVFDGGLAEPAPSAPHR